MRLTSSTLTLAGIFMFSAYSIAQTDSAYLNTGNAMLSKDFTQHITIKGEDLERFPFSSLDEAINVYFYGAYIHPGSVTYLIDGNLAADVNAYSIHDIESITLIQNAQALLNGAENPKQLALIKTRLSGNRSPGNTIAADIYPGRYQQLYLSKAHNGKRMQFGASLNFMRETAPNLKADNIISYLSPRISQFRGNAWMNTAIGSHSTLTIRINASPSRNRLEQEQTSNYSFHRDTVYKQTSAQINPTLRLATRINKSWSNEFNASYVHTKQHKDEQIAVRPNNSDEITEENHFSQTVLLREQLQYHKNINGWDIRPSASISFMRIKEKTDYDTRTIHENGSLGSRAWGNSLSTQQLLFVTPAMHIGYKDWFVMQGGIQASISKNIVLFPYKTDTILPFASASINIIRIIKPESLSSLKIFGSYAKTYKLLYGMLTLFNGVPYDFHLQKNPSNNFTAGSTLQTLNNSLLVSYTFEKRNYAFLPNFNPGGFLLLSYATVNIPMHRLSIQYSLKNTDTKEWRSGINITGAKPSIAFNGNYRPQVGAHQDQYPQQGWSGGWTNHFRFNKITAGLNALYFFDEQRFFRPSFNAPLQSMKANSFLLQHVYLGVKLEKKNLRSEIYASARNLFQNKESTLTNGDIRYLGLGVKAAL